MGLSGCRSAQRNLPDLVVEVISPTDRPEEVRGKGFNYLAEGITVWIADENPERIEVYTPGQAVKIYGIDDTLEGGAVLPGFSVLVRDIFLQDAPDKENTEQA